MMLGWWAIGCSWLWGPPDLERIELTSSGIDRTAWAHIPEWDYGAMPVVVAVHDSGRGAADRGREFARAFEDHFHTGTVFLFPRADYRGGLVEGSDMPHPRAWYGWDDDPDVRGADLIFFRELVRRGRRSGWRSIARRCTSLASPPERAMAWFASCFDPTTYAGFGVVGMPAEPGLREVCEPAIKRPMVVMHGAEDPVIPLQGLAPTGSVSEAFDWLLDDRHCGRFAAERPWIDGPGDTRARGWRHQCRTVRTVELWHHDGVEHCWPGSPRCPGVDAAALMFDYWQRAAGFP